MHMQETPPKYPTSIAAFRKHGPPARTAHTIMHVLLASFAMADRVAADMKLVSRAPMLLCVCMALRSAGAVPLLAPLDPPHPISRGTGWGGCWGGQGGGPGQCACECMTPHKCACGMLWSQVCRMMSLLSRDNHAQHACQARLLVRSTSFSGCLPHTCLHPREVQRGPCLARWAPAAA